MKVAADSKSESVHQSAAGVSHARAQVAPGAFDGSSLVSQQKSIIDQLQASPRMTAQAKSLSGARQNTEVVAQRLKYTEDSAEKEATLGSDFVNNHLADTFTTEEAIARQDKRKVVPNTILNKSQFDAVNAGASRADASGVYKLAFNISSVDSITVGTDGKVKKQGKANKVQGRPKGQREDITHLG
jgi:hypothetical protein